MAADDGNRYWADPALRSRFFDVDERTGRHRRFFDIDHLAAVRQEDEHVFEETHRLALRLAREGTVDGLRVDHPDGLADPAGYLRALRDGGARHVWVEKILDPGEPLRDWPVEGTVGYEFLNDVAALFVDPAGEAPLTDLWVELSGDDRPFGEVAFEAKLEQVRGPFAPEVARLRREAPREVGGLERTLASLPVYRTYVEPWSGLVEDADREAIREAGLPESLQRVLLLGERGWDAFVTRFQQTTPAIMAKGVEDTAFYRYGRLLALNDVGGDPGRFGLLGRRPSTAPTSSAPAVPEQPARHPDARHQALGRRARADRRAGGHAGGVGGARAALARGVARRCRGPTRSSATSSSRRWSGRGRSSPTGSRPTSRRRCARPSATRNWIEPDAAYEERVKAFCRALYDHRPFMTDFEPFAAEVARAGERAALGQLLLKLTVPGVPDIYQGDELLALSLVDPDNRRRVDWARRRELLAEVRRGAAPTAETRKLWLIVRALTLRAHRPEAFSGGYTPVAAGRRRGRLPARRHRARRRRAARRAGGLDRRSRGNVARRARRRRAPPRRPRPGRGAARRARDRAARARRQALDDPPPRRAPMKAAVAACGRVRVTRARLGSARRARSATARARSPPTRGRRRAAARAGRSCRTRRRGSRARRSRSRRAGARA